MDALWQEVLAFAALVGAIFFVLRRAWTRRRAEGCSHCDAAAPQPARRRRDGHLHLRVLE